MNRQTIRIVLLSLLCCFLFFGCGSREDTADNAPATTKKDSAATSDQGPKRDNTPKVYVPEASGEATYGNDKVIYDASHTDQGYIMVKYTGTNPTVRLRIAGPTGLTYTYVLNVGEDFKTFPLTEGNGDYQVTLYENVSGTKYGIAFVEHISATLQDEFLPYLYPNQYVDFTPDSSIIEEAKKLAADAHSDLDVVTNIYHYVTENITYDTAEAENVSVGYLPQVDEVLATKKGICFDYAALMTGMLRTQQIPTKLVVGYAGEVYHAWISVYITDVGWVDDIIKFDGRSWSMMDPTFAANSKEAALEKFVGDGDNYAAKFYY